MTAIEFLKRYRPGGGTLWNGRISASQPRQLQNQRGQQRLALEKQGYWRQKRAGLSYPRRRHVFLDAVRYLLEQNRPAMLRRLKAWRKSTLYCRQAHAKAHHVELYLQSRGISLDVIHYCISKASSMRSMPHHNCVFVGLNNEGVPRYAALRSTTDFPRPFKAGPAGSDKRFCFCIPPVMRCRRVAVLRPRRTPKAAHMTLEGGRADKYRLSLGGIYAPVEHSSEHLFKSRWRWGNFLANHPEVMELEICTDNDAAGRWVALQIAKYYSKEYKVKVNLPPKEGYDWADMAKEEKQERVARHRAAHLHLKEDDAR